MPTTPAAVALTNIADGAPIVASDHRNNYSAVQTALNALITILAGGSNGQVLGSSGGTTIGWTSASTPQAWLTGSVAANGTKTGSGFTVSKTGTGTYAVTFTSPYASVPVIMLSALTSVGTPLCTVQSGTAATTGFTVICASGGSVTDMAFNFAVTALV